MQQHIVQVRTWYGLRAEIKVAENHFHRVRLPGVALPHPGLVNWFLRRRLPVARRLPLTARHEFGHLQTLPIPLAHLLLALWPRRRPPRLRGMKRLALVLLTHQTLWEAAAETYTLWPQRETMQQARGRYLAFWGATLLTTVLGTLALLARQPSSEEEAI